MTNKGNRRWNCIHIVANDSPVGERSLSLWQMYLLCRENGAEDAARRIHSLAFRHGWSHKGSFGRGKRAYKQTW